MLKIAQFIEKCNKTILGLNHTCTVRRRTSALCGKCAGGYGAQLLYTSSLADFESFMAFFAKNLFL